MKKSIQLSIAIGLLWLSLFVMLSTASAMTIGQVYAQTDEGLVKVNLDSENNDTQNKPEPVVPDHISKFGIHILNVHELDAANGMLRETLLPTNHDSLEESKKNESSAKADETWQYVTVPFTLDDLEKTSEWQQFFDQSKEKKIIPIVRLMTKFENGAWQQPNRKEVVDQLTTLAKLNWPTDKKYIIIFNEVNHAKEWGGEINPESYADQLLFAAQWAKSEGQSFVVMPAAMDLAAPNGSQTMEAFTYLNRMLAHAPEVFSQIDIWNSHAYPNPAFSAPPTATGQNSLRGYENELSFIKEKTGRDLQVMITETGWDVNSRTASKLTGYYDFAVKNIWSDGRILAVTPFILQGDPGPFSGFSFLTKEGKPSISATALRKAISN